MGAARSTKAWIAGHTLVGQQQLMDFYKPEEYAPVGEASWPKPGNNPIAALREMIDYAPAEVEQFLAANASIYQPRLVSFADAGAKPPASPVVVVLPAKPHVVELGGSPEVKEAMEWLTDIYDHNLGNYAPYQDFNADFWEGVTKGTVMYHATSLEHLEAIKAGGLLASDETRGLSNRGMGSAVFTSSEPELVDSYGPVLLAINVGAMKADGYMPRASKEEPFEDSEMRAHVACKIGLSDYCPYSDYTSEGLDPSTVAFYDNIPAKYITVVRQPAMARAWLASNCRFAQVNYDQQYPMAGATVDGRQVAGDPPNQGSISSSLVNYEVLPGIREVSLSMFGQGAPSYYSAQEAKRTKSLAEQIRASGQISPLIVVVDKEGPYILEGGHRFDALRELGAQSFPAMVVVDNESIGPR